MHSKGGHEHVTHPKWSLHSLGDTVHTATVQPHKQRGDKQRWGRGRERGTYYSKQTYLSTQCGGKMGGGERGRGPGPPTGRSPTPAIHKSQCKATKKKLAKEIQMACNPNCTTTTGPGAADTGEENKGHRRGAVTKSRTRKVGDRAGTGAAAILPTTQTHLHRPRPPHPSTPTPLPTKPHNPHPQKQTDRPASASLE